MVWPFSKRKGVSTARIGAMMADLAKMKEILNPNSAAIEREKALAALDDFGKGKDSINQQIKDIETNLVKLEALRDQYKTRENKNDEMLKLNNSIKAMIMHAQSDCRALWDNVKKVAKKLNAEQREERTAWLKSVTERLESLRDRNAVNVIPKGLDPSVSGVQDKIAERQRQKEEARMARRAANASNRKSDRKGGGIELDDIEAQMAQPYSQQEQAFEAQVDANKAEQDLLLQELGQGLDVLLDMAKSIEKEIAVQTVAIADVDKKMDDTALHFERSQARLDTVLESTGGLARWCPLMICCIILLALVGYLINMARGV